MKQHMSDIQTTDLVTALDSNDPLHSWWASAPALPVGVSFAQFLVHTAEGAAKAAATLNTSLVSPNKITGYAYPTYGVPTQATDGSWSVGFTVSITGRKTLNMLTAPSTPTNA